MGKFDNFLKILKSVYNPNPLLPAPPLKSSEDIKNLSPIEKDVFRKFGTSLSTIASEIQAQTDINYDRRELYREYERAREHWLCASALELFADSATSTNPLHNATVWVTSENSQYEQILNDFLDSISIEEKIYDWAWNLSAFGDLFVKPVSIPGLGVIAVDDSHHPINITRIDINGQLVGFIDETDKEDKDGLRLLNPWSVVHFMLGGAKVKRPLDNDPNSMEYRAVHLLAPDTRQSTSKYGASILLNALPVYKRLRLAEDCLLMSRMTRGVIKYIYKVKVDGNNSESVASLIDDYVGLLKRARAMDTTVGAENFKSRTSFLNNMEDVIVPVFGDIGDLTVEKIGGEVDIKWIVDIEELRNQLAVALRCPTALLGGFVGEATGALGGEAISNMDIRFSRSVRRIQRALKEGLMRLCQIHLAFKGMRPDADLFDIHFSEASSEEETQMKEALDKGVDVIGRYIEMVNTIDPTIDKAEVFDYLNKKILKFNDFDISKIKKVDNQLPLEESVKATTKKKFYGSDLSALLPEKIVDGVVYNSIWESKYKDVKISRK